LIDELQTITYMVTFTTYQITY